MVKLKRILFEHGKDRIGQSIAEGEMINLFREKGLVKGEGILSQLKTRFLLYIATHMGIMPEGGPGIDLLGGEHYILLKRKNGEYQYSSYVEIC